MECSCGRTRWMYWFVLKKTPSARCKQCAYEARRTIPVKFKEGETVGNFIIVEFLGRKTGGHWYRVKGIRCGHEREIYDTRLQPFKGISCPKCTIGFCENSQGYVDWYWYLPDGKRVVVKEHRIVMERLLGRELLPGENVHHANGNRADNRPENLELWSSSQPPGQRVSDKVAWAKALLALYAPEALRM